MRRTKKKKSSVFHGVSLRSRSSQDRKKIWYGEYRKSGFRKEFTSEMEALAHFMAVFITFNKGDRKKIEKMLLKNPPSKGRMSIDKYHHIHGDQWRFPIDRHVGVVVDERDYLAFKDCAWFFKDGRVTCITDCEISEGNPRFLFKYGHLDEFIMRLKTGEVFNGRVVHLNGDQLDFRRSNLGDSKVVGLAAIDPRMSLPLSKAELDTFRQGLGEGNGTTPH